MKEMTLDILTSLIKMKNSIYFEFYKYTDEIHKTALDILKSSEYSNRESKVISILRLVINSVSIPEANNTTKRFIIKINGIELYALKMKYNKKINKYFLMHYFNRYRELNNKGKHYKNTQKFILIVKKYILK